MEPLSRGVSNDFAKTFSTKKIISASGHTDVVLIETPSDLV